MTKIHDEVLMANRQYSNGFDNGYLAMPPARQFAILTCMGAYLGQAKYIDRLTIGDQAESVLENVKCIKSKSLVPSKIPVHGYVYDVKPGSLVEVPAATDAGKAC